ncbi:endonuclease [Mycoplasma simbae]|uniref:endonuclease n=1 Tax=Mycoplasma simbae TaxID=36744 RepID=UPI0004952DAC|nr:endonuclease [Mycoplasma simbae]
MNKKIWMLPLLPLSVLTTVSCGYNANNEKMNQRAKNIKISPIASSVSEETTLAQFMSEKYIKIDGSDLYTQIKAKSIKPIGNKIELTYILRDTITNYVSDEFKQVLDIKYIPKDSFYSWKGKKLFYVNSNYYDGLEGLSGLDLFNALKQKQQQYWQLNISQPKENRYGELYTIYKHAFVDKYFDNDQKIIDIYSEIDQKTDLYNFNFNNHEGKDIFEQNGEPLGNTPNKEGYIYNREHLIPQSWFDKDPVIGTDAHFVWPSDKFINNLRGNTPFGSVENPTKITQNGTKIGDEYVEPTNLFKGDIARAYFYFLITHFDKAIASQNVYSDMFPYFDNQYLNWYLSWNESDNIDSFDIDRNNQIAKFYSGLRNPFSDYPELAQLIFKPGTAKFENKGILQKIE